MADPKTPKERIELLDEKIKSIKAINQKAQSQRDQLDGAKKQLQSRKEQLMAKMEQEFGITSLQDLKELVKTKIVETEKKVDDIVKKIQQEDPSLFEESSIW